jgi:hypothetical protein
LTGEDRGGGEKINNTPHFNSLPQVERKEKESKNFLYPLTLIISNLREKEKG